MNQTKGIIPAMMTFFDREESVDTECTRRMMKFMLEYGVDDFYLTGSANECSTMTVEEWNLVMGAVIDQMKDRMPVAVHVGDIDTEKSIGPAEHVYRAGADTISSVPPSYWKFRTGDTYNCYRDISGSTPFPTVVYNIQLVRPMDTDLFLQLAELPSVHGLKCTVRFHDEMGFTKEALGSDFMICSGCDEMAFSGVYSDADGVIGSSYSLFSDLCKQILKKVEESNIRGGMWLQRVADGMIFAASKYDFPFVLHSLMNWRDSKPGHSRRPFYNYQDSELEGLKGDIRRVKDRYQAEKLGMFRP